MNEADEVVIEDELSRFGLRTLHVMRMGGRVEREHWLERVPDVCRDLLSVIEREEKELGVWHMHLTWEARETVRLVWPDGREPSPSVWWWIGLSLLEPGHQSTLREAADWAAMTYAAAYQAWPVKCLVGKIEEKWGVQAIEVEGDGQGPYRLELAEEAWAPKGYVILI